MKTGYLISLLTMALLLLTACQEQPQKPWIPVLEQVDFVALQDTVTEAQRHVAHASEQLTSGESDKAKIDLENARQALFKIDRYFLPMTEVRQLIYDADRVYYLGRKGAALEKLQDAKLRLIKVGAAGGESVKKAVDEAIVILETLERIMDTQPELLPEKMQILGEKINLMILKGELILAGLKFS